MTAFDRRTTLAMIGAGMASLAGCSESGGDPDERSDVTPIDDDGDLPSYADVLPTLDDTEYLYGAIDVGTMNALLEGESADDGEEPTDPLIGNPVVVALHCAYGLELLLNSPAAAAYGEHNETAGGEETFVFVDGVYAFTGSYDLNGLEADLEDLGYESAVTADGHAVYTSDGGEVVGVSDGAYAVSYDDQEFDAVDAVERAVATAAGDRESAATTDEEFEQLLRKGAGDGGISVGLYTTDEAFDDPTIEEPTDTDTVSFSFSGFAGATGVYQRLAIEDGDASARTIVTYADEDRIDLDTLESTFGTEADEFETLQEGATVALEATYTGDLVDQ